MCRWRSAAEIILLHGFHGKPHLPPSRENGAEGRRTQKFQRRGPFRAEVSSSKTQEPAESVPGAFVESIGTVFGLPTWGHPLRASVRRHGPVTGHPLILVVTPRPVARDPHVRGRRLRQDYFRLERRRRLGDDDGASRLRLSGDHGSRRSSLGRLCGGRPRRPRSHISGRCGHGSRRRWRRSRNYVRHRLGCAAGHQPRAG